MKRTTTLCGRYIVLTATIAGVLFGGALRAATNELSMFLQKGLLEEEANQDLAAAAKAYEAAVQHFEKDRKLAATAVFRLAEVYRKQGRTNEATALHERVVREFSDQKALAELSRKFIPVTEVGQSNSRKRKDLLDIPADSSAPEHLAQQDEEDIRYYAEMVKNSPDLVNGRTVQLSDMPVAELGAPLHYAAQKGRIAVAEFLLANGADVNLLTSVPPGQGPSIGYSPLHFAAKAGHKAMVQFLLRHGAKVNQASGNGTTPLHLAAAGGFRAVMEDLLKAGADVDAFASRNGMPLHLAVEAGHVPAVELLITSGANLNAVDNAGLTPLIRAIRVPAAEMVSFLISKGADANAVTSGFTPLWHAVERKATKVVEILLANGAKPVDPEPRRNILHAALDTRDTNIVALLLRHGADPNQRINLEFAPTPIFLAVRKGPEMVDVLLRAKADTKATNDAGATALHVAAQNGHDDVVEVLLKGGALIEASDRSGRTPLMYAIEAGKLEAAEVLLRNKANPNAMNAYGRTPLGIVEAKMDRLAPVPLNSGPQALPVDLKRLLERYGANENAQRLQRISGSGAGFKDPRNIFYRHMHPANRFTLFEALAESGGFDFPRFTDLRIRRLKDGKEEQIAVDVGAALKEGDCSKDQQLEWGDIIELPRHDTPLNARGGVTDDVISNLTKCVQREIRLVVGAENISLRLKPSFGGGMTAQAFGSEGDYKTYPSIWLSKVVDAAPLRTSSDLTRVMVRRRNSKTQREEVFTFDILDRSKPADLWLQNGDVVEIPSKPLAPK